MWSRVWVILILPPSIVIIGTLGYHFIEGWNWVESLYMTVITISTVGYREMHVLSENGQLFTIFLILVSLGTLTYCIVGIMEFIVEGHFKNLLWELKMERINNNLEKHYIVCGFGRKGNAMCKRLFYAHLPFIVIEKDTITTNRLKELEYPYIIGSATDDDVLYSAKIKKAKGLIAILRHDADNVFLVLTARQINPDLNIIAWTASDSTKNKLYRAGANQVLSPFDLGGEHTLQNILRPNVSNFLQFTLSVEHEDLQIEQILVPHNSSFHLVSIETLQIKRNYGVNILGIERGTEKIFNPPAQTIFNEEDILIALGSTNQINRLQIAMKPKNG